jgi:hypothetical protein
MYEDYVSYHARVLEGVRTARVKAIVEMRLPRDQYEASCVHHDVPAVALWVHSDTGEVSPLCNEHLRASLEEYDREAESYPPAIVPLKRVDR